MLKLKKKKMGKRNHTNLLNGFLPMAPAGRETVESTLRLPVESSVWCLSKPFPLCKFELLPEKTDPLFHLKDPIPCDRGNELLLLVSLVGVVGNRSLGLLLALTFAFAETVGTI